MSTQRIPKKTIVTRASLTPSMSPCLPVLSGEIAEQSIDDVKAGNAVELVTYRTSNWSIKAVTYGAMMGTHIRVGQDDNLFEKSGVPFKSNARRVEKVIGILSELNIDIASPQEANVILGLAA